MTTLTGKVVLITGAARRLGAVMARTLHCAGATVVIHYHTSQAAALALQAELNDLRAESCFSIGADLNHTAQLAAVVQEVVAMANGLDVLINNASSFYPTPLATLTEAQFDDLIGSNLKAPLFLAQAAAPYLQQRQGCIINMVDIHGRQPLPDYPAYCAAKAGLWMLTKVLAQSLGSRVRVNGVAPGAILFPEMTENHAMHQAIVAHTALQAEGKPEDIANTVLFLVRDAPYITGQVIPVDGGRLLNY